VGLQEIHAPDASGQRSQAHELAELIGRIAAKGQQGNRQSSVGNREADFDPPA